MIGSQGIPKKVGANIEFAGWLIIHPEWPVLALSAACWVVMLFSSYSSHHLPAAQGWMLMVGGMMLPLQIADVRRLAFRSKRATRQVTVLLFIFANALLWAVIAIPAVTITSSWTHPNYLSSGLFIVAAIWTQTNAFKIALWKCHSERSVYVDGWPWVLSTLNEGFRLGYYCILTCLPAMIACAVSHHFYPVMIFGFVSAYMLRSSPIVSTRTVGLIHIGCAILVWPI